MQITADIILKLISLESLANVGVGANVGIGANVGVGANVDVSFINAEIHACLMSFHNGENENY